MLRPQFFLGLPPAAPNHLRNTPRQVRLTGALCGVGGTSAAVGRRPVLSWVAQLRRHPSDCSS